MSVLETFEGIEAGWALTRDTFGAGSSVERSNEQAHTLTYSAKCFTTNASSIACVRDVFSDARDDHSADEQPGTYYYQRTFIYIPSSTLNNLGANEYVDICGFWQSSDGIGWRLRLFSDGSMYGVGYEDVAPYAEVVFNLYGTFPTNQWVELEFGLRTAITGLDRCFIVLVNGNAYGWITYAYCPDDTYNRIASGILRTNSDADLTIYVDDWDQYTTGLLPIGTDNRPTAIGIFFDYRNQSGINVEMHGNFENDLRLDPTNGLYSHDYRLQSGVAFEKMPEMFEGWIEFEIGWPQGTPPIPPETPAWGPEFYAPMPSFRKRQNPEQNLEVVPRWLGSGNSSLYYEAYTGGYVTYATWQLPVSAALSPNRVPEDGDRIRVQYNRVGSNQLRVRVDYYDASAGAWSRDVIDDTRDLTNIGGVNFMDADHHVAGNTIDSKHYSIKWMSFGALYTESVSSQSSSSSDTSGGITTTTTVTVTATMTTSVDVIA